MCTQPELKGSQSLVLNTLAAVPRFTPNDHFQKRRGPGSYMAISVPELWILRSGKIGIE
jgi:hypothetical protein